MKKADTDRRVRRTRELLRRTLTRLLMEKDLKDITVSELTARADVNRGTFYLHYKDIYDLFEQIEKEILEDFCGIIARHKQQQRGVILMPVLLDAFKFIAANADVFMALLRTRETTFLTKVIEMSRPRDRKDWELVFGAGSEEFFEYYYAFITNGCVALLRRWFSLGMPESPEYMAEMAGKMMADAGRALR
jgi:AcrR family transcriptional regulator